MFLDKQPLRVSHSFFLRESYEFDFNWVVFNECDEFKCNLLHYKIKVFLFQLSEKCRKNYFSSKLKLNIYSYRFEGVEGVAHVIDPKAMSKETLYGVLDPNTREWTDGLFTHILR